MSGSESENSNIGISEPEQTNSETLKGVVKWFNDAKGYGFIEHTSGKDVFVHYSSIISEGFKSLKDGEPVEYEMVEGTKGLHAVKVVRVAKPEETATDGTQATATASEATDKAASTSN